MRFNIIKRLVELKENSGNFSKTSFRWRFEFNGVHVSEVNFEELDDEELTIFFERVIARYYRQG